MRSFLELVAVLIIGLGLGSALSWASIQRNHGFGSLNIGVWTAWPLSGSREADPYTKAKVAADGDVPLGAAEGLAFEANTDSIGGVLLLQCRYLISGQTPPARFWTLTAHLPDNSIIRQPSGMTSSVISQMLLRNPDGTFAIEVGNRLASGNRMAVLGEGSFKLYLRLYDSPITSTSGIVDPQMPTIEKLGCAS